MSVTIAKKEKGIIMTKSNWKLTSITVEECKYCDGTTYCTPYADDDVKVCTCCGAEWEPLQVKYTPEELGMEDLDDEEDYWSDEDDYLQEDLEAEWAKWDSEEKE